jgi:hypothetical protein
MRRVSRAPPAEAAASSTKLPCSDRSTHCATAVTTLASTTAPADRLPETCWRTPAPLTEIQCENNVDRVSVHYEDDKLVDIAEIYDDAEARVVIEAARADYAHHYG